MSALAPPSPRKEGMYPKAGRAAPAEATKEATTARATAEAELIY